MLMCGICGCETAVHHDHGSDRLHEHVDARGRRFMHVHDRTHVAHRVDPAVPARNRVTVDLEAKLFAKNDAIASDTRAFLHAHDILALNLVSSPGSGKTTLLVRTVTDMLASRPIYVVEGDQETSRDAELIRETGAPAVQLNTGTGCHLDAEMVAHGILELSPADGGLVLIENVGNLVCPALFDLGERAKVAILSVTEGDDKPLKYPHMFRAAELLLINKIDLLPYVDFNILAAIAHAQQVNPELTVLCVSARTGEGMTAWYAWIARQICRGRTPVLA
jgi:hydrogenase nickel incorporation protein HypB